VKTVTPEQWQSVENRFAAIAGLPPEARDAALAAIADEAVRSEVASLLLHASGGETVAEAMGAVAAKMETAALREQRIGPYKLVRRLGYGGQGAVFEAERGDGAFQQRVAIKLIKWETDNDAARERFRQERQILAGLEHPHIARLLDGGATANGAPYLVMEFVDGLPLTAAAEGWTERRKLKLFLDVASAVTFAHRSLIVHRDLKPANIMVTKDGAPKLLDFGIAKLLDSNATRTITGLQALTPHYASPEQVRGQPITTASDVYSLGVVLYELLAGRRPYEVGTATPVEMDRIICQAPSAPPGLGDELDSILLMALRKEPERRYGSVQEFAADIERYLDHLPVKARPDTIAYRTGKYVRRHWVGLVAAAIALAGICGGAGVAIYQARIAQQRFQDVRQLANSFLFDVDDQIAAVPGTIKAQQMLVNTALKYLDSLSRSAGGDVSLQRELAQAYGKVGNLQMHQLYKLSDAVASFAKSLAIYGKIAQKDSRYLWEMANLEVSSAFAQNQTGNLAGAIAADEQAVGMLEPLAKTSSDVSTVRATARAFSDLSTMYQSDLNNAIALGAATKSLHYTEAAVSQMDQAHSARLLSDRHRVFLTIYVDAGEVAHALDEAGREARYIDIWAQGLPNDSQAILQRVVLEENVSQLYDSDYTPSLGDTANAIEHMRAADDHLKLLLKDPNDTFARGTRAVHLRRFSYLHGRTSPETGIKEGEEAIARFEGLQKESSGTADSTEILASTRLLVAEHLSRLGQSRKARDLLQSGLAEERTLVDKTKDAIHYQRALLRELARAAAIYRNLDDLPSALRVSQEAAELAVRLQPQRPREAALLYVVGNAYVERAHCMMRANQRDQALQWFERDAALWRDWPRPNEYVALRQRQALSNLAHP
jgi:eukaryotic-like serine/threonine-protein kinase